MWLKWHDIDYSMTAQFAETAAVGTFETCWDVRSMVAVKGIADIEKAVLNKRVSSHKYAP
jgi:hypothetical protein